MGGCYNDRDYSSSCYEPPKQVDNVENLVKSFFKTGNRPKLLEAYKQLILNGNSKKRFIRYLLDYAEIKEGINEFPGIEIESKLEVILTPISKKPESVVVLTDILDILEFPPVQGARFLMDACNAESQGTNNFFGTDDEERFVVIEKGGKWYLKEKGQVQPYHFGIPGEEYVLRRPETRKETNPLVVAQTLAEKYADGNVKFQGALNKIKAESFLVNTVSGRLYSVVISCASKNDKKKQWQLEIEYAGYIPGFKQFEKGNERNVVEDILYIDKSIVALYSDTILESGYKVSFIPTTESKFEFVSGKSSKQLETRRTPLLLSAPEELARVRARK